MIDGIAWIIYEKKYTERTKGLCLDQKRAALNGSYKTVLLSLVEHPKKAIDPGHISAARITLIQSLKDQGLSLKAIAEE